MEAGGDEANDGAALPDLTCPHCGASNPASARVCQECGRRLDLRNRPGRGSAGAGDVDAEAGPRFRPLDGDDLTREGVAFVDDPPEPRSGDLRTCGACGAVDAASARFCRVCGAPFGAPAPAPRPRSAGLGRLAMAMLVLALIAAAAVAGHVLRWPPAPPTAPASARRDIAPAPSSAAAAVVASDAPPSDGPAPAPPPPAAVAAAAPPPTVAAAPPVSPIKRMIADPVWVRRPRAAAVAALYPAAAEEHGLPGQATIDCAVRPDGRLGGCRVVAESPAGLGFGRATLRLAPDFRMTTVSRSGQPVAGRRVRVPIRWRLTE